MNGLNAMKIMYDDNEKLYWTDGLICILFISAIIGVIYGFCKLI